MPNEQEVVAQDGLLLPYRLGRGLRGPAWGNGGTEERTGETTGQQSRGGQRRMHSRPGRGAIHGAASGARARIIPALQCGCSLLRSRRRGLCPCKRTAIIDVQPGIKASDVRPRLARACLALSLSLSLLLLPATWLPPSLGFC